MFSFNSAREGGAIFIDAGAQDDAQVDSLAEYLADFFDDRPSLKRSLKSITRALRANAVVTGQLELWEPPGASERVGRRA